MAEQLSALRNFIGGGSVDAVDGARSQIVNPSTGEAYLTAPLSGPADLDAAFRAASTAFETWSATSPAERQRALLRIADALQDRADEFVVAECENTGKPLALTASEELPPCIDQLRYFAGAARVLDGLAAGEYLPGFTSWIRREPVGVVGQVTPWNYPLMMAVWKVGPALATGNTVVLKPSDTTPSTTVMLAELCAEFLPDGVLNVVTGDRATGAALVAHPRPDLVAITGSVRAGIEVATAAAQSLKRVHLELGGKAPVVVFQDADIDAAAAGIAAAGYFNAGQDCTAATRVLCAREVHDEFVMALSNHAGTTVTGPPADTAAAYGPLNNANQLVRVAGMIDRLPGHADVVTGGSTLPGPGYFYPPTVVSGLRPADEIVNDEVFGPVITVQPFADESEALELANRTRYGLASSVWTTDHSRALRMSAALNFGCVWINTHIPLVAEMPHGGFGHSGYGKDLSKYALEDYTRIKHVMSALG